MTQQPNGDPREIFQRHFRQLFYRALDYLVLFLYAVVVSVGALGADFVIFTVVEWVIAPSMVEYPIVARLVDLVRIGSAILVLVTAFVHAVFSAWSQIRFELEVAGEPTVGDRG